MKAVNVLLVVQIFFMLGCANTQDTTMSKVSAENYVGQWETIDYQGWRKGDFDSSTIHKSNDNEIVWTINGLAKSQSLTLTGDTAVSVKRVNLTNHKNALLTAKNDTLFGYIATYSEELGTYHDTYVMVRKH